MTIEYAIRRKKEIWRTTELILLTSTWNEDFSWKAQMWMVWPTWWTVKSSLTAQAQGKRRRTVLTTVTWWPKTSAQKGKCVTQRRILCPNTRMTRPNLLQFLTWEWNPPQGTSRFLLPLNSCRTRRILSYHCDWIVITTLFSFIYFFIKNLKTKKSFDVFGTMPYSQLCNQRNENTISFPLSNVEEFPPSQDKRSAPSERVKTHLKNPHRQLRKLVEIWKGCQNKNKGVSTPPPMKMWRVPAAGCQEWAKNAPRLPLARTSTQPLTQPLIVLRATTSRGDEKPQRRSIYQRWTPLNLSLFTTGILFQKVPHRMHDKVKLKRRPPLPRRAIKMYSSRMELVLNESPSTDAHLGTTRLRLQIYNRTRKEENEWPTIGTCVKSMASNPMIFLMPVFMNRLWVARWFSHQNNNWVPIQTPRKETAKKFHFRAPQKLKMNNSSSKIKIMGNDGSHGNSFWVWTRNQALPKKLRESPLPLRKTSLGPRWIRDDSLSG